MTSRSSHSRPLRNDVVLVGGDAVHPVRLVQVCLPHLLLPGRPHLCELLMMSMGGLSPTSSRRQRLPPTFLRRLPLALLALLALL
eukprot:CAMPEP_0181308302 /NCGR_PEP_ID=MMETSP1101-20121128/11388_1 /TAXON_ID=46948 /ORGANISM="Rhodomonas abbreviata, Strain Caron Lab Isolate" /LENGTH=84 /DNA_ID=CAMNT_0023414671 /DNA_START=181 /DNA_END=431 /DNA_ORIENTATION=+